MLSQYEIEKIPDRVEKIMGKLEARVMKEIILAIKESGEITSKTEYKIQALKRMGVAMDKIEKLVAESFDLSEKEIDKVFGDTFEKSYSDATGLYKRLGVEYIPFSENTALKSILQAVSVSTKGEFDNISKTLGMRKIVNGKAVFLPLRDYFTSVIDTSVIAITNGVFDVNSSVQSAINELADSGIRTVDYESGKTFSVETATRRAIMTSFTQVHNAFNERVAEDLGTESFEVSWHATARPTHQPWQGRVWTKEELVTVCGLGEVTGLNGANCYHSYFPFIEGVSERLYTDEWLDSEIERINTPVMYNGVEYTLYEATQRQRALETRGRELKKRIRLLETTDSDISKIQEERTKLAKLKAEYKKFSKHFDLEMQVERMKIANER